MEGVDHLAGERSKAQFDVEELKIVWAGSRHNFELSDRISRLVASDPVFQKDNRTRQGRKELFKNTLRKAAHAWKRIIELHLSEEEAANLRTFVDEPAFTDLHWWWPGGLGKISTHAVIYARLIADGRDYGVHGFIVQLRSLDDHLPLPGITIGDIGTKFGNGGYNTMDNGVLRFDHGMFVPAIKGQGTEEQQKKWLPLAYKMQIIGCYAQTELGHGSNVQGLETTATFDTETDEFIIHSPTLTSSKWWPGGLGKISTHAVIYARLIADGRDYGVHGFIVQLRSLDDHLPLPGITIGDIGTKFGNGGYNTMDNGVLRFDHVRIPREQMLMRLSQVTRDGKFVQSNVPRQLVYGTMVYVRQTIVADASRFLSRAVCIATRYSAVRRQFGSQNGGVETQVIDYKTQQSRLFPLLASAYAFRFVGEWLKWLYADVTQRLGVKDFSTLPEAHACTAGLKSLTTSVTAAFTGYEGWEICAVQCPTAACLWYHVCIATRYSAVRRQFGSQNGGVETQVIDYKTQQSRLFPLLASAYAFRFVGEWLKWLYADVTQRLGVKDFSTLPEAHACTAGLKSLTTSVTADGIEECRKLCGGHGYLCSSGLPELFAVFVPACTYEGDNVVLLLQVARFLMKTVSQLGSGKKPVGTTAYMGRAEQLMQWHCAVQRAEDWLKPNVIVDAFEARAARMSVACAQKLAEFANPEEGFLELSADLVEAAVAHCELIVVSKFIEKLQQDIPGKGVKEQLEILCNVYALFLLHKHQGDFLSTGCITPKQAALANDQLRSLYSQVRPNAIALVDAFNYTDHYLGSILGRYDGNVYPKLYEEAWKDPLNDSVVPDGYQEYVRPILKQQLRNARL
ncbi:Peroxisomal acyl-coenzyme A oxidase 1 [Morella rubra]|uniref:acyl-CoA oxidase n=1 Tax=Morella rubra TaxID=262757 RepID=A0A6A1VVN7_9ROSI|nr:Peroxisomal acyl-coenzyme A oxidase 1 [Morella rubra]